jgi:hypothetical protein
MKRFPRGAKVIFTARTGKKFEGIVKGFPSPDKVSVLLGDDPFPVEVGVDKLIPQEYIDTMTTKTAEKATTTRTAKKAAASKAAAPRRRRAAASTETAEVAEAVAEAPKRGRKAAAAKPVKAAAKTAETANPYRPGSNLFKITDLLLKGGKRSAIVGKLQRQIDMHPYTQDKDTLDVEKELDKRVMLTAGLLARNFGYTIEKSGRGMESGTIKVVPSA